MSTIFATPSRDRLQITDRTVSEAKSNETESVDEQLKAIPKEGSVLVIADHDITRLLSYAEEYAQSHPWVHVCLLVYCTGPSERSVFTHAITLSNEQLDAGNPLVPIYVWRRNSYEGFHALDQILKGNDQAQIVSDWRLLGDGYELTIPGLWRARRESRDRIWAFTTAVYYMEKVNTLGSQILNPSLGDRDEVSGFPMITAFTTQDHSPWDPFPHAPSE